MTRPARLSILCAALLVAQAAHASAGAALVTSARPEPARDTVVAAVDSTAWATLQLEWLRRVGDRLFVGPTAEVPFLLWLRSGPSAGRAGARLVGRPLSRGAFGLTLELATRLGAEDDAMGTTVTWDVVARAMGSVHIGRGDVGLVLGVQQGLASWLRRSSYARSIFADRYEGAAGPGGDGVIPFPVTRLHVGVAGGFELTPSLSLVGAAGLVVDPASYGAGAFDRMMVGVWPFSAELGLVWRF